MPPLRPLASTTPFDLDWSIPHSIVCKCSKAWDRGIPCLLSYSILWQIILPGWLGKLIIVVCFVAILQYADDTIIFLQNNLEMDKNLKLILYLELMSCLKINFNKSEVIMIHGNDDLCLTYAEIFNCQIGVFPIKNLRVPIRSNILYMKDWIPLEDKSKKKLMSWKGGAWQLWGEPLWLIPV